MGAVESSAEDTGVIRFVDSVNTRHEKESTSHGQEHLSTEFVPEGQGNAQL